MNTKPNTCCVKVYRSSGAFVGSPCRKKASVERDGKWYCLTHDPIRVEEKNQKKKAESEAASNARAAYRKAEQQADMEIKRRADLFPVLLEALRAFVGDAGLTERERLQKATDAIAKATGEGT